MRSLFRKIEAIPFFMTGFYNWIAKNSPFLRESYKEIAEEVCSKMSFGRILDVGTGPGYLPMEISKRNPNLEITGIDISEAMVELAKKNAEKEGLSGQIQFQVASADKLPFEENYFDFILSSFSFHHWLRPERGLKEICRVLKPAGEAWIYDIRYDISREGKKQLREKYGWFFSLIFLFVTRTHSSVASKEVEEILSASEIGFQEKLFDDKGPVFRLKLLK